MVDSTTATDQSVSEVGECTVRLTCAECEILPLSPVMVRVDVATGVEFEVVMLRVALPEPVIEAGVKLALAPEGGPIALSATFPLKPFCGATVTV